MQTLRKSVVPSLGGTITAQSSQLASGIPIEVLLNVSSHLKTPDYCALRISCKQIEDKLLDAFAQEFFTKRQFMWVELSFQALVDISHSRFSNSLNYVIFSLEQPIWRFPTEMTGPLNAATGDIEILENRINRTFKTLHYVPFFTTGQDVEMLAEAFGNLRNLETIGIRDFNSRTRRRDYPDDAWKSYGSTTIKRESGPLVLHDDNRPRHPIFNNCSGSEYGLMNHVFMGVLRGAGKSSSPSKGLGLEVIMRRGSFTDTVLSLPPYVLPVLRPVLRHLRVLFLDLSSNTGCIQLNINGIATKCPNYFLMKFLSETTELDHLRLNFRSTWGSKSGGDFLSWLSKSAPTDLATPTQISELPRPVDFKHLRRIDIGMFEVEPNAVLATMRKFQATIETISLHRLTLTNTDVLAAGERVNLWAKLFGQLAKLDLNLKGINMSHLAQHVIDRGNVHVKEVTFKDSKWPRTRNWAGTGTQSALRDFKDMVIVVRLNENSESDSSENDSEQSTTDRNPDEDSGDNEDEDDD
ncbi:F-box domain-containing protein [Drepanopeziza brunnea f. sp. 'multigermtubi' MB_m1]|uniref:F-box domain-containing protein n=1 Tax=Marssonina brunnea f. sp. multigermtubi (strain MB_m1) TaxID=1072389 RepID=K1XYK2_MARBU|nr:F-box domain-containing protein [Drepanopeziza brunnea f. sp. 'multigermtubi' MB_m1]EKD17919.1 F-box domain-containing protein [Drepanopeziza brunnea f. sp. 'multigermtubi' MB_m1]